MEAFYSSTNVEMHVHKNSITDRPLMKGLFMCKGRIGQASI